MAFGGIHMVAADTLTAIAFALSPGNAHDAPEGPTAADLVFKDFRAASFGERLDLESEVLVLGGDASVADQHERFPLYSQNS
jgi:hypothetical protein